MAKLKQTDPYRELEVFLKQAEDDISRSFTELSGIPADFQRKKTSNVPTKYLGPAARKRRFLAKRQRSRTVDLSLPSLNGEIGDKNSQKASSDVSRILDDFPSAAVSMDFLHKSGINVVGPFQQSLNGSRKDLSNSSRSISVRDLPSTPASPYLLKSIDRRIKYHRSVSPEWKSQPRLDFSKPETVSRWASEILAEIDSLPGSCSNLSSLKSGGPQVAVVQPMIAASRALAESRRRLDEACSELKNFYSVENLRAEHPASNASTIRACSEECSERKTPTIADQDGKFGEERSDFLGETSEDDLDSTTATPTGSPVRRRFRGGVPPSFAMPPPPSILRQSAEGLGEKRERRHRKSPRKRRLDASTQESHFHNDNSNNPPGHPDRSVRRVVANILKQAQANIPPNSSDVIYENSVAINRTTAYSATTSSGIKNSGSAGNGGIKRRSVRCKSVQYDEEQAELGDAEDEESSSEIELIPDLLDACTQTSPFSLSRSSSFTWMSEGDLEEQAQLERLVFPGIMSNHQGFYRAAQRAALPENCSDSNSDSDINDSARFARASRVSETRATNKVVMSSSVQKRCSNNGNNGAYTADHGALQEEDSLMLSDEASGVASSEEDFLDETLTEARGVAAFRPLTPPRRARAAPASDGANSACATMTSVDSYGRDTILRREERQSTLIGGMGDDGGWREEASSLDRVRGVEGDKKLSNETREALLGSDSAFDESLKLLLLYTTDDGKTLGPEGWKTERPFPAQKQALASSCASAFTPIRPDAESRKPPSASSACNAREASAEISSAPSTTAAALSKHCWERKRNEIQAESSSKSVITQRLKSELNFKASKENEGERLVQLTGDGISLVNRPTPVYGGSQQYPGESTQKNRPKNLTQSARASRQQRERKERRNTEQKLFGGTAGAGAPWREPGKSSSAKAQSPMAESIYDNVPNLRKQLASQGLLRPTVDSWSLIPEAPEPSGSVFSPSSDGSPMTGFSGSDFRSPPENGMPRDISMASGILADSESSPVSPGRERFAILDGIDAAASVATPDSAKSLTSSEGSFSLVTSMQSNSKGYSGKTSNGEFASNKEKAEFEASESCKWLKAAGFPQYAQMYEDHKFPIDVKAVEKDHEFLEDSDIQALFRRLHTLNRCAIMKLDNNVLLRRPLEEDSDEEESVALSRQWRYQRKSKTWSRIVNEFATGPETGLGDAGVPNFGTDSSTSPNLNNRTAAATGESLDSLNFEAMDVRANGAGDKMSDSVHVMVAEQAQRMQRAGAGSKTVEDINFPPVTAGMSHASKLQRSQSERIKDKARAFMRRMGPHSASRRRKSRDQIRNRDDIVIGSPVLVGHQSASPPSMRMFKGTPVGQESPAIARVHHEEYRSTERLEKRQGRVFLMNDSSMEFEKVDVHGSPILRSYEKETFIDSNYNIDRIFTPQLPSMNSDQRINGSGSAFSHRSDEISKGQRFSGPSGSPMLNMSPGVGSRQGSEGGVPLILFNPRYGNGTQNSSPASMGGRVPGFASRQSLESSPEFAMKSPCRNKSRQDHSLRVRVDMEEGSKLGGTRGTGTQPEPSPMDSSESESPKYWEAPERRDSGVGSSLSRSPSGPTRSRVRWHSFQRQHRPVITNRLSELTHVQMDTLSVPQMIVLRQFALLRLTSLMEKYSRSGKASASNSSGPSWNWGVQKLFRRMKMPEQKGMKDHAVFGVALHVVAQRTGQPLPQCILHAMRFLRQQAADSVGLFRKSGVRSRINSLKAHCENSNDLPVYESQQAFDVADLLKQYFRELPEPLLTTKLSETFIGIHLDVPRDMRVEAMQKAILLLPDENREVLQSLLLFLYDVSRNASSNQMTAQNLAVCFAPSLFQLSPRLVAMSPTRRHKTITGGLPNEKELRENQAAQACLTQMIVDCKKLFWVPSGIHERCNLQGLNEEAEPVPLKELGLPNGSFITHLETCIATLLKEHRDRWKGWMTEGSLDGVEITCKKLSDSHPLKLWRVWADVEAPPREVLERVLRERDSWDEDVLKWRVVERLGQESELFQYVQNDMPPHPTREFVVVRTWKKDMLALRGGCVLVETSVTSPNAPMIGGVRAVCLAARYLIEPSGAGRSRITYVCRIDTKGRGKGWYNKVFGYICARQIAHLRDSFRQRTEGPETKV